jgi:hypothetical protein
MAVALTFADITGPRTELADKYQAAHDFICILKTNERLDEQKLVRLGSLISPDGGKEIIEMVRKVHAGDGLRLF